MDVVEIIAAKRDGRELTDEQLRWFVATYARSAAVGADGKRSSDATATASIADEQASALLMAIFLNGMSPRELRTWTAAMIDSGERLDLSRVGRPTVDKHSTGGVGDKTSLILCPLLAACGAAVPQLSGRGLGHTGGTLDKMESIPRWRANLSNDEIVDRLRSVGAVIAAAGSGLAPADRKLYALRDVTATVESIPLIASSIMSKKIAEGTSALVLDVKVGTGAFMTELDRARRLAETMVQLGNDNGVRTMAVLTRMDTPLGRAVGNALEVDESIAVLRGGGPSDLVEVCTVLARSMAKLAGVDVDPAGVLASGGAFARWEDMVRAQGGDPAAPLPRAAQTHVVPANRAGIVARLDARAIGVAAWRLGAGRARKEDPVSATAGIVCVAKPGDNVVGGAPVLELHIDDPARLPSALAALDGAIEIDDHALAPPKIVIDVIEP